MRGRIEVAWDVSQAPPQELGEERIADAARAALAHGGRGGAGLAIVFVDEPTLTRMHAEHLDDPSPTDVITFALGDEDQGPIGELYVSLDRAREVARRRGYPLERELLLYVVHGALHLCGFDDHAVAERERMRAAERSVMSGLGFAPDSDPHELD